MAPPKVRVKTGGDFCSAPNCQNARYKIACKGWSFFRFPRDQARCDLWKQNCRRADLMAKTAKDLSAGYVLCRVHFEDNQFNCLDKKRLVFNAVPTLFDVPNPPRALKSTRRSPKKRCSSPADHQTKKRRMSGTPNDAEGQEAVQGNGAGTSQLAGERLQSDEKTRCPASSRDKTLKKVRQKLYRKEKKLRQCKCTKKKRSKKNGCGSSTHTSLVKKLAKLLPPATVAFIDSQLRAASKKKKGVKWTDGDKTLALSIYHASPKTYKLLKKIFVLPSVKTLQRVLQNIEVQPGFNENILHALSLKVKSLPSPGHLCAVIFDEMSIKEQVVYDQQNDRVEGLEDFGGSRTVYVANHATVFMVRGLQTNWKQPVGYFLSSGPIRSDILHSLLLTCINKVTEAGLKVKVVIADQGSNNRSMFSKHLHATEQEPFFFHNQEKVHVLYDPPHLLKNIRNNMKKSGFSVNHQQVTWQHVEDLFSIDKQGDVKLVPKLTERHISLPPFSSLKVRYAAQVLSHSVAAALSTLVKVKLLPEEARVTATFIDRFDKLFNCFNSRTLHTAQIMANAMTANSEHVRFLQETLTWLDTVTCTQSHLPCLVGWKMAIRTLLSLWQDLKENHRFSFLITSRLNQDCLENFFSRVRCNTGHVDNPSASQLRAVIRQLMVDQIFVHSEHSNCEDDAAKFLLNVKAMRTVLTEQREVNVGHDADEAFAVLDHEQQGFPEVLAEAHDGTESLRLIATPLPPPKEARLQSVHDNVIMYIAGYIVHKIRLKLCSSCKCILSGTNTGSDHHTLLTEKQYAHCKDGGLKVPSPLLVDAVQQLESVYSINIGNLMYKDNVKASLSDLLCKTISSSLLVCPQASCKLQQLVVQKFINVRFHFTLKDCSRQFAQKCFKRNRKIMKVSHF